MPSMDDYVAKANIDLARISTGGVVQPTQLKEFLVELTTRVRLLQLIKVLPPLDTPEWRQPRFGFSGNNGWVMTPDIPLQETPEAWRAAPRFSQATLVCKPFKVVSLVDDHTLRAMIDGKNFIERLIPLLADAMAPNVEAVCVRGDTTIVPTDLETLCLSQMDGLLKKATASIVDVGGQFLTPSVLDEIELAQLEQYRVAPGTTVLTSPDAVIKYRASKAARPTSGGDEQLRNAAADDHHGIPVEGIPAFPSTTVGLTKETEALRCVPAQIVFGFQNNMQIELERKGDAGGTKVIIRSQFDCNFLYPEGVTRAERVRAR